MEQHAVKNWKKTRTEPGPDLTIFKTRFDWLINPRNGKELKAVVLEAADWVNVIALTPEQRLIVVSQYRFGIGNISLEIPAGLVDPGETPRQAAARELEEETGYLAREWRPLGWCYGNPAFLNNRAFTFLALDVKKVHEQQLEDCEHIVVEEITLAEVKEAIDEERMRNAMTLLALSKVFDMREIFGAAPGAPLSLPPD